MYMWSGLRTIVIWTRLRAKLSRPPVFVPAFLEKNYGLKALKIESGQQVLRSRWAYQLGLRLTVKILEAGGGSSGQQALLPMK
ncbi:hypothetical protein LINPERPRIM_LOCUS25438 [Linum perenne]